MTEIINYENNKKTNGRKEIIIIVQRRKPTTCIDNTLPPSQRFVAVEVSIESPDL